VVAPEHDGLHGDNVVTLTGSLNPVDDAWLAAARARFPALGALPSPRTAVLVGGPTRAVRIDRGGLEVMLARIEYALARHRGRVRAQLREPVDYAVEPLRETARVADRVRTRLGS